jgi:hypothetical protein
MATTGFNGNDGLNAGTKFQNADGTTVKAISAGANFAHTTKNILATSTDTVARVVDVYLRTGSVNYLAGSVSVPAGAGTGGAAAVDLLASLTLGTGGVVVLHGSDSWQAGMEVAVTTGKEVDILVLEVL